MNIYDEFINSQNPFEVVKYFSQEENLEDDIVKFVSKYDYLSNDIKTRTIRPSITDYSQVAYNHIKKIISFKSQYLFGKNLILTGDVNEKFENEWNNNKLSSHYVKLCESLLAYGKAAEIIYIDNDNNIKHLPLISGKNGDEFYAFFDNNKKLGAFSRYYKIKEISNNKIINYNVCEIYTQSYKYIYKKLEKSSKWVFVDKYSYNKMPVVYYEIKRPLSYLLSDIQNNYNEVLNELSDVNSQIAYPILLALGELISYNDSNDNMQRNISNISPKEQNQEILNKLKTGGLKIAQLQGDGNDLKYLTWNSKPETLMFEIDNSEKLLYKFASIPNITIEDIKAMTNISGIALKVLFIDAEIDKYATFTKFFNLERTVNLYKYYLDLEDDIIVEPNSFLPQNTQEIISNLVLSKNNNIISQETAVGQNPLVKDAESEIDKIKEEQENQESEFQSPESYI